MSCPALCILIEEDFTTSSSREILPVVEIDDVVIGGGSPGETTRMSMDRMGRSEFTHNT